MQLAQREDECLMVKSSRDFSQRANVRIYFINRLQHMQQTSRIGLFTE